MGFRFGGQRFSKEFQRSFSMSLRITYHAEGVKRTDPVNLGRVGLKAGANSMTVTVTGKAENSTNYLFGLDALELKSVK